MYKIGVSTTGLERNLTTDAYYALMAKCGVACTDVSLSTAVPMKNIKAGEIFNLIQTEKDLLEFAKPFGECAEKYHIQNNQSHAPFPTTVGVPETDAALERIMPWFVHAADSINSRLLVVHPIRSYTHQPLSDAQCEEMTIVFCEKLIPAAKEYGVTICLENLFAGHIVGRVNKLFASTCSNIDQACRIVDTLNSLAGAECFGFCLDTGHLLLASQDIRGFLPRLGGRLKALHIHDNDGKIDQHHAPFTGVQDWDYFTDALAESPYDGCLNFELGGVWADTPAGLWQAAMEWVVKSGRWLADEAERKRTEMRSKL